MAQENPAVSPAESAKAASGDGPKSGNVTSAQLIQRFVEAEKQPQAPDQTTDTPPAPKGESKPSSVAEPAPAASPESAPEPTPEPEGHKPEGTEDDDGEESTALSPESSQGLDPKIKAKIDRKFARFTARTKAAEGQVEQLKAQVAQLQAAIQTTATQPQQAVPATPTTQPPPLPDIKTPEDLKGYRQQIKTAARTIEALLDSEAIEQSGTVEHNGQTYTKAQLKGHLREARAALEDAIPAQEEYFRQQDTWQQERHKALAYANQQLPWLGNKESDEFRVATQAYGVLQNNRLLELNREYYAGLIAEALVARQKAVKPKEAPKESKPDASPLATAAKAPPVATAKPKPPSDQAAVSTGASVARIAPEGQAMPKLKGSQSTRSVEAFLTARDKAKQGQR